MNNIIITVADFLAFEMLHEFMRLEDGGVRLWNHSVESGGNFTQFEFPADLIVLFEIQLDVFVFVILRDCYLISVGFEIILFDVEVFGVLFHDTESQS